MGEGRAFAAPPPSRRSLRFGAPRRRKWLRGHRRGEGECASKSEAFCTIPAPRRSRRPKPTNDFQQFNGFGGDGLLRLGEPGGYLFLFCFAFRFPITRLGLAVPVSFHFALDRITAELATVFGGDLVPIDFTGHIEGNFIPLELAF